MATPGTKVTRVKKEYEDLTKKSTGPDQFKVNQVNADLYHWKAVIAGPPDTPYEGGKYQIDIEIPNEYPYQPPKVPWSLTSDEVRH